MEIIQHHRARKNATDLGGLRGGPEYTGTLGRILEESGIVYQAERLSQAALQGEPCYNTGVGGWESVSNTIQCGIRKCVFPLDIADIVGLGVHTGQTSTHGGTNLGDFLRIWWAPGNTVPGLATGRTKHHNLTVSADQFGGRR